MTQSSPDSALDPSNNEGYGSQPVPTRRDDLISDIIEKWRSERGNPNQGEASVLVAFAERMASRALLEEKTVHIFQGLRAISFVEDQVDQREAISALALLWHSAEGLRLGGAQAFASVSAEQGGVTILDSFSARSDDDRDLQAMGYEEFEDENGFFYQRRW